MKNSKFISSILVAALILTFTGCGKSENNSKVTIKEPGKSITVIDNDTKEEETPSVTVDKIDRFDNINITDWLDKETVIVSKDNESLGKLSLSELSDSYPKSLYLYNLTTKEFKLLKEKKDTNLSGAVLSADKKYLLYTDYTLGDPAFFVMNMNTLKTFVLSNESIAGAKSAKWADNEVIGAAYIGGAYTATTSGDISVLKGLEEENLFLVDRINDKIYYNTSYDETLNMYDTVTKEKTTLEFKSVSDIIPSPDKNQMLILQYNGSKLSLLLTDTDGSNQKVIAEGTELGGVSWSPDQRLIAYNLQADVNGSSAKGLYVYDVLTGTSTQIAVDTENAITAFGPTGKELFFSEYNGTQWNSSIIYLK
ncbi:hypothetical protein R2R35_06120 [Anaerocolumna sp. AGMB13020]|uniref:hypothetical protein n=1 Tax=Anaerocolumna sp. AGMB13020 TaxID=3081750 RepID=UPI002954EAF6|nr:hypothetical protein [Anaerocolumna sp. AGMB13020]WOO38075.1 hypothetical protein R2R35_06120 [Anaerocolumna sp. AGMB13020]